MNISNTTYSAPGASKVSQVQSKIQANLASITDLFQAINQLMTEVQSLQPDSHKPANSSTQKPAGKNQLRQKTSPFPGKTTHLNNITFTAERKTKAYLALQQTKLKLDEAKRLLQGIIEG